MNIQSIQTAGATLGETGLTCPLPDGRDVYFNYHWLRDNCPSSFDPVTRERSFDIFALAAPPRAAAAHVEGDALVVAWQGEDHVSRLPLAMLQLYADGVPRPDPADLPRRAWYADHYASLARFSQPALMSDPARVRDWIEALITEGVAIVTDMPDSDAGLDALCGLVGAIRPSFFGTHFDVRLHLKPTNTAFTAAALPLHTDLPAEEHAPGIQYLHCRANTVQGGRSLFADGVAVANDFRALDPEGFRLLCETEIPFNCEHESFDMRARQRVIELDRKGEVSGVTMSQHLLDIIDLPQAELDAYYPAFRRFGRMLREDRYLMRFTLAAGECIVFDNHRVVHGREAYSATSGERHLRGCYTDREEMRSTFRVLSGAGRFAG